MDLFPRKDAKQRPAADIGAAEDGNTLATRAPATVDDALGSEWYDEQGNKADIAAHMLCLLRRARAGQWQRPAAGDDAVRAALGEASPEAVVWLASRAISYMDENGFPEAAESWLER
jgi:hypothetical protein